jgi:AcrR family transcriptional regulator
MARWEPDARGRLRLAALELYGERGFEQVTVSEIAARVGLTERTFFRHFADKREVLFASTDALKQAIADTLAELPASTPPIDAAVAALKTAGALLGGDPDRARLRHAVIVATPELCERELIKLADFAAATAEGLRTRGVAEPGASLAAEACVAAFKVAYTRWLSADDGRASVSLDALIDASVDELAAVFAGRLTAA